MSSANHVPPLDVASRGQFARVLPRLAFWAALVGLVICTIGAKWQLIRLFGNDVPYMDQWNGEAIVALEPWLHDRFNVREAFWTPHNEHRPGWTRLWALAWMLVDGQWDPLLVVTANAALHAGIAALILFCTRSLLVGPGWWLMPVTLTTILAAPIAWENTLQAFQVQFYFVLLTAIGHLALVSTTTTIRSWRWWVGCAAGLAGLGAMASAFAAPLAVLVVRALRAWQRRKWTAHDTITSIVCGAIAVIAIMSVHPEVGHQPLRARSLSEFLLALAHIAAFPAHDFWPLFLLVQAPLAWWLLRRVRDTKSPWSAGEAFLLGVAAWLAIQACALAFARGHFEHASSSRYYDVYGLFAVANAAAFGALWRTPCRRAVQVAVIVVACVWAGVVGWEFLRESRMQCTTLHWLRDRWEIGRSALREFVHTDDAHAFLDVPVDDLPYPSHEVIMGRLRDVELRRRLPVSIRPPVPFTTAIAGGFSEVQPQQLPPLPSGMGVVQFSPGIETSTWRSAPIATTGLLPILRISFAADPRLTTHALRLETNDGRVSVLQIDRFTGRYWQTAHLFVPTGARTITLAADAGRDGQWLAFASPVELGFASWLTHQLRKSSVGLIWIGASLLALGLAVGPPVASGAREDRAAIKP